MSKTNSRFTRGLKSFVTYRLARVQNRLNAQAAALLRANCDLSLTEWRVISLVNLLDVTTATVMAREAEIDKGQISRAVKSLTDNGYLFAKDSDRDGRQTLLSLSPKGYAIHARLIEIMRGRQQRLIEDISENELEAFYKVLEKLDAKTGPVDTSD